eukprot:TRINITY_DN8179_c0_g1_i2.p1 TRINITY_DN8179_c0_g1~~TRINITY_DN8179_c0_g1_i2.p1  ORF type:complete len:250 (-),score=33.05 TRINITY_DN8179_c0_g1_i2:58-807(-)
MKGLIKHKGPADKARTLPRKPFVRKRAVKGIEDKLFFGRLRRPSKLVVLLHGLDDSAEDCAKGVVGPWLKGLPGALIAVPQSTDKTSWSSETAPGYNWVTTERDPPWEVHEERGPKSKLFHESLQEYRKVLRARCRELHVWSDSLLEKHQLSNKDVVLVGFSLGAYLSSIVGAQRNVRGVVVCGGMCSTPELRFRELLPKQTQARFCAVNGTLDETVNRKSLEDTLSRSSCGLQVTTLSVFRACVFFAS